MYHSKIWFTLDQWFQRRIFLNDFVKIGLICIVVKNQQIELNQWEGHMQGRIQGGGAPGARPPKIGKNMIFWRKIVIFHTKYPNNFRASLRNWK